MCTNVTFFPRPRFASEFGFQGYPSIHAWLQVSDPSVCIYVHVYKKYIYIYSLTVWHLAYSHSIFTVLSSFPPTADVGQYVSLYGTPATSP